MVEGRSLIISCKRGRFDYLFSLRKPLSNYGKLLRKQCSSLFVTVKLTLKSGNISVKKEKYFHFSSELTRKV